MRLEMIININMGKYCCGSSQPGIVREEDRERCVLCWRLTDVPKSTPIAQRKAYVQGAGQLCESCYCALLKEGAFSCEEL